MFSQCNSPVYLPVAASHLPAEIVAHLDAHEKDSCEMQENLTDVLQEIRRLDNRSLSMGNYNAA